MWRNRNRFFKLLSDSLYDLPVPINLTYIWNFGSIMGLCFLIQYVSGLCLACYYTADVDKAFDSVIFICRDVHYGWFMRSIHSNGASCFFACIYLHIARGIYYQSYHWNPKAWLTGCMLYVVLMSVAFTGYVLPWGQMSYWGATVITNMFGVIPYVGQDVVEWLWGGYTIGNNTLKRFFVFHFTVPYYMLALIVLHIFFLHDTGSSNPLGVDADGELVRFHPYYSTQDFVGFVVLLLALCNLCLMYPDLLSNPLNWVPADPYKTPEHIQPEWYFLFAYAILRSIPNKTGGVLALVASVGVLFLMPLYPLPLVRGVQFNLLGEFVFWCFASSFVILSYVGSGPVGYPYDVWGFWAMVVYFSFFVLYPVTGFVWDDLMDGLPRGVRGEWVECSEPVRKPGEPGPEDLVYIKSNYV